MSITAHCFVGCNSDLKIINENNIIILKKWEI